MQTEINRRINADNVSMQEMKGVFWLQPGAKINVLADTGEQRYDYNHVFALYDLKS